MITLLHQLISGNRTKLTEGGSRRLHVSWLLIGYTTHNQTDTMAKLYWWCSWTESACNCVGVIYISDIVFLDSTCLRRMRQTNHSDEPHSVADSQIFDEFTISGLYFLYVLTHTRSSPAHVELLLDIVTYVCKHYNLRCCIPRYLNLRSVSICTCKFVLLKWCVVMLTELLKLWNCCDDSEGSW